MRLTLGKCLPLALAVFVLAAAQANAGPRPGEARWCIVYNPGLGNVVWDCRFPTLAVCAETVGWRRDACLENPNWHLPRARLDVRWTR